MESILGIELTENKIKILEIHSTEKGLEATHLNKIDLPENSTKEGIITEPKLIAERIAAYLKENNISTRKAVALINSTYSLTKIIRLPFNLSDDQIRLNLEAELSQYQTFIGKEAVINFNKLEEISEEGIKKINVLFTATFKALINSYLKTATLAGLDLVDIDVPMLCLLRALDDVDFKPLTLDAALFILISQKYLELCILKGNRPRFLHSIEIDMLDFDKDKAGFVERLVSAIKLVVNFYQVRFMQGEQITRIVVNPTDAKYNQIHILLQEKFPNIPIQLSQPLSKIYIEKDKPLDAEELKFVFSGLVGATLRLEDKKGFFNLNLLSKEKTQKQSRLTQVYTLFISLTFILSVMVIFLGWVVLKANILEKKISRLARQIEEPPPELEKAMSIKVQKDILERQIAEASLITDTLKKPFYFKDIAKAMVLVPPDLWLINIALDEEKEGEKDKNLILTGEAKTEKSIFNYVSNLSTTDYFNSVELVSSRGEADSIKFVIRCAIK